MKQARAEETRSALLLAAARQFDRHGYLGTSLSAISDLAAVSKGALSFHFGSKSELADAVQHLACVHARAGLEESCGRDVPALQLLIDGTHAALHSLTTDPLVRGGLRLARERGVLPSPDLDCRVGWYTALRQRALRARGDRSLRPGVSEVSLADFALTLVVHQETAVCSSVTGETCDRRSWPTEMWRLLLPSLVPVEHPWEFRPEGRQC